MKKKILFLCSALLMFTGLQAQNNVSASLVQLVKEAAGKKAISYMNLIPQGSEKDYGFNNRSDFSRTKIGEPYQTYYVSNRDNKLILLPGNEWRVPISIDGNNIALLTVQITSGKAEVVNFGANVLARKLQEFEQSYANSNNDRILIRNTFLKRDYISTDLSAISSPASAENNSIEINSSSSQVIYRISAGVPEKITIASLYGETMSRINNTSEK